MPDDQADDPMTSAVQRLAEAAPESLAAGFGGVAGLVLGAIIGGPAGAAAGAYTGNASGPLIEAATRGLLTMATARFRNSLRPLQGAGDKLGVEPADVVTMATGRPDHLELLTRVMEAASRVPADGPLEVRQKVRALGLVLANGLDGTSTVDEATALAAALHDMEAPHVQALAAIGRWGNAHPRRSNVGTPATIVRTPMPVEQLRGQLHSVDGVVDSIVAALERHGLIRDLSVAAQALQREFEATALGRTLLELLTGRSAAG